MSSVHSVPIAVKIEEIVITPVLHERPSRNPDLAKENDAFRELANYFPTTSPDEFLDRLVELTIKLCEADTVGISVEETNEKGERIFRWMAMAGELKNLAGGTTPRDFSPSAVCLDQDQPILMAGLDRAFPYFKDVPKPIVEALLLPWGVKNGPIGTFWIVAHTDRRKFCQEDVRIGKSLAAFAAGAIQWKQAQRGLAAVQIVADMAHHINNPLQSAAFALYIAKSNRGNAEEVQEMISIAEIELQRVMTLSAQLLEQTRPLQKLL